MRVWHGGEKPVVVLLLANYPGKPEDIPRRVVGVYRHVHSRLVAYGHYLFEEEHQIFKEFLMAHALVFFEERAEFGRRIALVPAGEMKVFGVERGERGMVVCKRFRPVGMTEMQVRAHPVEDGHEIVAYALHAHRGAVADVLLVRLDILCAGGLAELDVLVHGDGLDDFHFQSCGARHIPVFLQGVEAPHLSHRGVINGGDHPAHSLDLFDVRKRDAVLFAVPAESHFHKPSASFTLKYEISLASPRAALSSYSPLSVFSAMKDASIRR